MLLERPYKNTVKHPEVTCLELHPSENRFPDRKSAKSADTVLLTRLGGQRAPGWKSAIDEINCGHLRQVHSSVESNCRNRYDSLDLQPEVDCQTNRAPPMREKAVGRCRHAALAQHAGSHPHSRQLSAS